MTITSVLMQIVQQVQFIGMLSSLDVPWPSEWFAFTSAINVSNLKFENLIGTQKAPAITFRMIFIMVSICVPLAINVLLLVIFQPAFVVLWYLDLCIGIVFLAVGLAGQFLPNTISASFDPITFIIIGAALVGFALFTFGIFKIVDKCTESNEDAKLAWAEELKYERRFHRKRALKHCGVFLLCGVVALLCTRLVIVTIPRTASAAWFDNKIFLIVGIVFAGLAILTFLFMVLHFCRPGRRLVQKATHFFSKNVLLVMLTLISASFIPTVQYGVDMFMCTTYTCPAGTKFNPYAYRSTESYDTSESIYCDPCNFTVSAPVCGSNVSSNFDWCPAFSDRRYWKYPDTTCSDEATVYFYLAAAIVLIIYLIGIPSLFFIVIHYLTDEVFQHARIGRVLDDEHEDEVWNRHMQAIQPVAASLYDPFRLPRRYYTLVQLAHRLLITFTISIAAAFSRVAVVFVLVFHGLICLILVIARPYINFGEQVLAVSLAICNVLNSIYAVVVWRIDNVPSYTTWFFIVLNGIIPAIMLIVGGFLARRARTGDAAKNEKRALRMQLEAIEAQKATEEELAGTSNEILLGDSSPTVPRNTDPFEEPSGQEMAARPHMTAVALEAESAEDAASPTALAKVAANAKADDSSSSSSSESDIDEENIDPEVLRRLKRLQKIRERHNDAHCAILNDKSTNMMNKAFMGMGVFFIVALGIAFFGFVRSPEQQFLIGGEILHRDADTMFAGYPTWEAFTSKCCCLEQVTPATDYTRTERWVCDNGKTLERGRIRKEDGASGLPIRGFCATSFNEGCVASSSQSTGLVELTCPDASSVFATTSADTRKYLW